MRLWVAAVVGVLLFPCVGTAAERRTPVVEAVERVSASVVSVRTQAVVNTGDAFGWFFRDFGSSRERQRETVSQGSGVIIDAKGYVLTNYHVIAVGGDVEIELADGRRLTAEVVGTAPDHDLAVLLAKSSAALPYVPMGQSSDLMIGETVIAIGNPFGLSHTVTTGVVSALHRLIRTDERVYTDFIQTDASINPGNSGGPLLNINGQLIGVNTAIYGKAQGIGFAIPIDKAWRIVNDLLKFGEVRRPFFGFEVQDLTPDLAQSFALKDSAGALVAEVDAKGPAAGHLKEGDVVVAVAGERLASAEDLRMRLGDETVGAKVALQLLRGDRRVTETLVAGELSAAEAIGLLKSRIGVVAEELDAASARSVGMPAGTLLVKSVTSGSPAAQVGIRRGDWLRAINSEKIFGREALGKAMARSYWRGRVVLLIQRGRVWQQLGFQF